VTLVDGFIKHLSEKPWSDYTKADYTPEQWHSACLIHQHDGAPTSKAECKLPVKTPGGAVNRNACHAAAAALAGARGGVHASAEEKSSAAKSLIRLYHQMDEKPPPSLLSHSQFLEHYGKKGMKWGAKSSKPAIPKSQEHRKAAELRKRKAAQLTNKQLKDVNARINLEQNYTRMNPGTIKKGLIAAGAILAVAGTVNKFHEQMNKPATKAAIEAGKKALKIKSMGKKIPLPKVPGSFT
jgi:hypothetical protein